MYFKDSSKVLFAVFIFWLVTIIILLNSFPSEAITAQLPDGSFVTGSPTIALQCYILSGDVGMEGGTAQFRWSTEPSVGEKGVWSTKVPYTTEKMDVDIPDFPVNKKIFVQARFCDVLGNCSPVSIVSAITASGQITLTDVKPAGTINVIYSITIKVQEVQ